MSEKQPEEVLYLEYDRDSDRVELINGYHEGLKTFENEAEALEKMTEWNMTVGEKYEDFGGIWMREVKTADQVRQEAQPKIEPEEPQLSVTIPGHGLYRFKSSEVADKYDRWKSEGRDIKWAREMMVECFGMEPDAYDDITSLITFAIIYCQE